MTDTIDYKALAFGIAKAAANDARASDREARIAYLENKIADARQIARMALATDTLRLHIQPDVDLRIQIESVCASAVAFAAALGDIDRLLMTAHGRSSGNASTVNPHGERGAQRQEAVVPSPSTPETPDLHHQRDE